MATKNKRKHDHHQNKQKEKMHESKQKETSEHKKYITVIIRDHQVLSHTHTKGHKSLSFFAYPGGESCRSIKIQKIVKPLDRTYLIGLQNQSKKEAVS